MREMFNDILEKDETVVKVFKPNSRKFWWSVNLTVLVSIILIPLWPVVWLICRAYYNNRFYAITDKRVLIRGGIIGIDYKSVRLKDITATVARVSALDKLLKTNTGSIEFGSPGSPLSGTQGQGSMNPYRFSNLENPYNVLREVNEMMELL